MNPIQDLAERIAAGEILPSADSCTLLVRDFDAAFDWTAASGAAASPQEPFEAADLGRFLTAIALIKIRDLGLGDGRPQQALDALRIKGHSTDAFGNGAATWDERFAPIDFFELGGRLLEDLTGQSIEAVLQRLVLDPAGMTDTHLLGQSVTDGMVTTAADLASLLEGLTRGRLIPESAWLALTATDGSASGCHDPYGLGLKRYLIGDFEVVGFEGSSGEFAFWLPFDAALTGTINATPADRRPLVQATVDVLC